MRYALNEPLASFVFIYCMEMYVKICTSCTNIYIYIYTYIYILLALKLYKRHSL